MQIYTIQWIYLSVYSFFLNGDFILLQTYKPRIMNWKQLISNKRFGLEELHEARKDDRSEFQRDYDRLIFSAPFPSFAKQNAGISIAGKHIRAQPPDAQSGSVVCRALFGK